MAPRSEDPKLIVRVINFELVQPTCPRYVTDRQVDGRTTYDSNIAIALRASHDKKPNYRPAGLALKYKRTNIRKINVNGLTNRKI